ncbi:hypothetical protein STEG23_010072 [Scotinomys teguina]
MQKHFLRGFCADFCQVQQSTCKSNRARTKQWKCFCSRVQLIKGLSALFIPHFRLQQNPIQCPELYDGNTEPFLESIVQLDSYMLVNGKIFSDELKVMFLTTGLKGLALQ